MSNSLPSREAGRNARPPLPYVNEHAQQVGSAGKAAAGWELCRRLRSYGGTGHMAETAKGKKIVAVAGHTRKQDGKKVRVPEHRRSTPETSKGKK
jgi:hypothetical protein